MAFDVDSLRLWDDADEAKALSSPFDDDEHDTDETLRSDDENEHGENVLVARVQAGRSRIFRFADGDIHYCDACCPYTEHLHGDLVCKYTGRVVGRECEQRTNACTGRTNWSVDPDAACGVPSYTGQRRNMKRASQQAFFSASNSDFDVSLYAPVQKVASHKKVRVASLCTAIKVDPNVAPKTNVFGRRTNVLHEAEWLYRKLILSTFASSPLHGHAQRAVATASRVTPEALFKAVLRKYVLEQAASGLLPCLDEIMNLSLAVHNTLADKGATTLVTDRTVQPDNVEVRRELVHLAATLFACAAETPYFQSLSKGTESFRPFCVGVFYACKRGMTLTDGSILVPKVPVIERALSCNRNADKSATTKSLHLLAHRGLMVLQRCLASVPRTDAARAFESAIRTSQRLSKLVLNH